MGEISGRVNGGEAAAGIVVSDGYPVTTTDESGRLALPAVGPFVFVTRPTGSGADPWFAAASTSEPLFTLEPEIQPIPAGGVGRIASPGVPWMLPGLDCSLRILELDDGSCRKVIPVGVPMAAPPLEVDGRVFVRGTDSSLHVRSIARGNPAGSSAAHHRSTDEPDRPSQMRLPYGWIHPRRGLRVHLCHRSMSASRRSHGRSGQRSGGGPTVACL
jgi:hypothetical protein